jgi:hypothetical protein
MQSPQFETIYTNGSLASSSFCCQICWPCGQFFRKGKQCRFTPFFATYCPALSSRIQMFRKRTGLP